MVLGIGALASLGLALPTGLAFGYGYGYGVRQGYSAFKPPSKGVNDLKLSPNPVQGSLGAGLQSAEEITGQQMKQLPVKGMTNDPQISKQAVVATNAPENVLTSKTGKFSITRQQRKGMSRQEYKDWYNEVGMNPSRPYAQKAKYRYR